MNLGFDLKDRFPTLDAFISKIPLNLTTHATALHVRSEELLSTVFGLGGLLPSQVKSEAHIDNLYQSDHLITNSKGEKVLLEFEGPYHFIKDEFYMMQED